MSGEPISDERLMASIREKDVSALEQFYDRYRVLSYSLALRTLGSPADAEEVVQEAFTSVWRSSHTYQSARSSPRSWLLSIVHHRCIDHLRGRQSRPAGVALEDGMDVPDTTDVWAEVAEVLTGEDVRRALAQLPEEQRSTIEMAYFQGYTHTEIAERMSVPLGTVKGRMRIGLHKLRSALTQSPSELAVE